MSVIDYSATDYLGDTLQTADTYESNPGSERRQTDVVIVGAGPSGLAAGTVLAEAGQDVVILEAGRFWDHLDFQRRQSWAARELMQEQATRVMTGNAFIPVASGRGVGGGTLVNSAICFRGPDRVLDRWVHHWGLDYFEGTQREELFEEVEQLIGVEPTPPQVAGNNSEIARRGFRALGIEHGYMPRNAPTCAGCGTCQTGCPTGAKATADLTWLPRFLRAGGRLFADTRATGIDVDSDTARGVEAVMTNGDGDEIAEFEFRATRTIVAAGAINTPLLLQNQNLANSSGQVGRNLHVHPTCGVIARFNESVRLWSGATQGYYAKHPDNPDILLETFSASPDIFLSQIATTGEVDPGEFLREFRHLAACGLLLRDESSGRVTPAADGTASISYRINRNDINKMRTGLYLLIDMFFAAGSRAIMPMVDNTRWFAHKRTARARVANTTAPSRFSMYSSHPHGTCRIGDDPDRCVVRPDDGQTWDIDGLHIVDSSLFPSALGTNPQVTIMAQALALARRMV